MTISLEAIRFNHDPNSAVSDALTIRKNQTEGVSVPEWKRGMTRPEESLAAYTTDRIAANRLTIEAQFRREAGDPSSVDVSAVGNAGSVLGNVTSRRITFVNDLATELFDLDTGNQNPGVNVSDIAWNWFIDGSFRQATNHRIYTILELPKEPWGQPGDSFQLPWTEVLEHACRQARGARNVNDAAAMLTQWVYSLGQQNKLRYDDFGAGASAFTIPGMRTFRCTTFLQALADTATWKVNCTDCATILSSFANILGCDLLQSQIGDDFETNRIEKIGSSSIIQQPFRFHEVAWKFPQQGAASVYDCCLNVDGDADPASSPFARTPVINMPFGGPHGGGYQFRLIARASGGRAPREKSGTRMRRKIDGATATPIALDPQKQCRLEKEFRFPEWQGTPKQDCFRHNGHAVGAKAVPPTDQPPFLKNYSLNKSPKSLAGLAPGKVESFKVEDDPSGRTKDAPLRFTEVVWSSDGCSGAALKVLTYECSSIPAARSFLVTLLGGFNLPGIQRRTDFIADCEKVKIGDVAFAGPDNFVLLFARANNVVLIQNVGQSFVPLPEFAHAMDTDMTSSPDPKPGQLKESKQFQVCDPQIRVGEEVHIHTRQELGTNETFFKVFAPAGEVSFKGDELVYRSKAPGEQSVTILAQEPGGVTTRQVLKLSAKLPETNGCICLESNIKEESVMPDVTGVWSSIRPTNNGDNTSADMTVDGIIEITSMNSTTGVIAGFYKAGLTSPSQAMTGHVDMISDDYYTIELSHPIGTGLTRHYTGHLATFDNSGDFPVQIVAGRYDDRIDLPESARSQPTNGSRGTHRETPCAAAPVEVSAMALSGGQDNGTWVATKP